MAREHKVKPNSQIERITLISARYQQTMPIPSARVPRTAAPGAATYFCSSSSPPPLLSALLPPPPPIASTTGTRSYGTGTARLLRISEYLKIGRSLCMERIQLPVTTNGLVAAFAGIAILASTMFVLSKPKKIPLTNRLILVTGCDSGFGLGVVKRLADQGASVIAACYTEEGLVSAQQAGATFSVRADLSKSSDIALLVARVKEISADTDLFAVIHNAGTVIPGYIDYLTIEQYRKVMEVNFFAIVNLDQYLLPLLKVPTADGAKKREIVISSVDGLVSLPGNAPYDASKFAIEAYADSLRVEQSFWNIAVSVINPSTMRTPLAMNYFNSFKATYDAAVAREGTTPSRWQREWPTETIDKLVSGGRKGLESIAQDPAIVVEDLLHAMQAATPKPRYLSGSMAKTLFWFLWVCPESWSFAFKKSIVSPPPTVLADDKMPSA